MTKKETLLTPSEAAKVLQIAPTTLRLWAQEGKVPFTTTLGGHRRFCEKDIQKILSEHNNEHALKVLVAEDDEQLGDVLLALIPKYLPNATVEIARDGFDVGEKLYTFRPQIILLDLILPFADGFSICERIKSSPDTQDISVIAMTGEYAAENVNRITTLGAEYCIAKPLDHVLLIKYMTELIN